MSGPELTLAPRPPPGRRLPRLSIADLREHYAQGGSVADIVPLLRRRWEEMGDPAVLIGGLLDGLESRAATLDALSADEREAKPLFGVPVVVKDNIAVAGLPTTAGCPAFAADAASSAHCVERLIEAGAIIAGRANMDQFATGLVGTRSPYGTPRNTLDRSLVPGGSSSGSAAAVAHGLVPLAIGTDTAGSGRVPAATQQVIGLKPTRGLVSSCGVVPACRSLDTVSVFTRTVRDAAAALDVLAVRDPNDPWTRSDREQLEPIRWEHARLGIPLPGQLDFVDDQITRSWRSMIDACAERGAHIVEVDLRPFLQAGELLYGGPFLAERYAAVGAFIDDNPDQVLEVTRQVIRGGAVWSAADYHNAVEHIRRWRIRAADTWSTIELLVLPTVPAVPTLVEVQANPIETNHDLGRLTSFSNLLDMAAITIPGLCDELPGLGVTIHGPANSDRRLVTCAADLMSEPELDTGPLRPRTRAIPLVVAGAHLKGEDRNHELAAMGASMVRRTRTAPIYRFWALPDGERPALERVGPSGTGIEVEVWAVPEAALGAFVAAIAPPLAIGSVELDDGTREMGFVCEQNGLEDATDITDFRGWRTWRGHRS